MNLTQPVVITSRITDASDSAQSHCTALVAPALILCEYHIYLATNNYTSTAAASAKQPGSHGLVEAHSYLTMSRVRIERAQQKIAASTHEHVTNEMGSPYLSVDRRINWTQSDEIITSEVQIISICTESTVNHSTHRVDCTG